MARVLFDIGKHARIEDQLPLVLGVEPSIGVDHILMNGYRGGFLCGPWYPELTINRPVSSRASLKRSPTAGSKRLTSSAVVA